MKDIQLSPHFRLSEFLRSSTATARKIDNTPSLDVVSNLQQLCIHVLEPLRTYANESSPFKGANKGAGEERLNVAPSRSEGRAEPCSTEEKRGSVAVVISSGYRSKALNTAVGGAKSSQHMTGEACDIRIPDEATGKKWFTWMMDNLKFHQLIWEKSTPTSTRHWIHVAYKQDGHNAQHVIQNLVKNP